MMLLARISEMKRENKICDNFQTQKQCLCYTYNNMLPIMLRDICVCVCVCDLLVKT